MSRKHFVAIAAAVKEVKDAEERRQLAERLASVCASASKNFDRARFLHACNAA